MDDLETLQSILFVVIILSGVSLMCQGYFIMHGKHGYKNENLEKRKIANFRKQLEDLFKNERQ